MAAVAEPDLALALELADQADALTLRHFRRADLAVATKADHTPVTEADTATETMVRERLAAARPHDGVLGEEEGSTPSTRSGRRWIVDPIDGTKNYARGVPVWATLLALEVDGTVTVGVVSAPALGARWWAARGAGAWRDGTRIGVSSVASIEQAFLVFDGASDFAAVGLGAEFAALARRVGRTRGFGDFWGHMMVADGAADVAVEVGGLALWDLAAPQVIVEEAGGRFTDLRGRARADGGDVISSNGLVHDEVVAALVRGAAG